MKKDYVDDIIKDIPEQARTPTVKLLLTIIETQQNQLIEQSAQLEQQSAQLEQQSVQLEQQSVQLEQQSIQLEQQSKQIEILSSELKRIKKLKEKPKLRASKLPKDSDDEPPGSSGTSDNTKKRPGSSKRQKNSSLKITHEQIIKAKDVPAGAVHKGYKDYTVQELAIEPVVIKYRLERWQLANGNYYTAKLPVSIEGHHYGPTLRSYVIHQYHHQGVTQPLLYAQLKEWKIDISRGQLNRMLNEAKESFHKEKAELLSTGLRISNYIQVDDTGARHQGENGYCTHIGNELFAWFSSSRRKNRINFLKLLQCEENTYYLSEESFEYMKRYNVAPWVRNALQGYREEFYTEGKWEKLLNELKIEQPHSIRLTTEAALIGSLLENGFSKEIIILSDDAGQFNVFLHALCWLHAERGIVSLIPTDTAAAEAIEWARKEIWEIYHELLEYKNKPKEDIKTQIETRFDRFSKTKTINASLNRALKRFEGNKAELLLVLKHPEIPLHNNMSERDIREYVKRRKISGSTRSEAGRNCRDTFASLKKTAKKLDIGFWDYLTDRISQKDEIPKLSMLMEVAAKG